MSETFGKWLEQQRLRIGLNQTELAERSHVSKATISLYEADKVAQPRLHQLDKIAKVLSITSDAIRSEFSERNMSSQTELLNIDTDVDIRFQGSKNWSDEKRSRVVDAFKTVVAGIKAREDVEER